MDGIRFVRPSADEDTFSTVQTFHESYQLDWNAEVTEALKQIVETLRPNGTGIVNAALRDRALQEIGELSDARRTLAEVQGRLDNDLLIF